MRRLLQKLALYSFHILFARPVMRWVVGVRYRRRSPVPDGPYLVVSNHNSHLDAAVLMGMFPLSRLARVHPVAAADYFGSNWFMRTLAMALMNGIPIQRRPVRGTDPLGPIAEMLRSGHTLIFFPEGSRGEAGVVAKFRPGIGRLVQEVEGLKVVPVFLSGPERIWPRGQLVPVPLNIDANVGRPVSYSRDDEPRRIAEHVRRDVLALAPPPPPAPGHRPAPSTRIAVCGIDESSREAAFRSITARLGRLGPTIGVSDPMLEADDDGFRESTSQIPTGTNRPWIGVLGKLFRTGPMYQGREFVHLIEMARIDEALNHAKEAHFIVSDGNALVDLLAAAWPGLARTDEREQHHLTQFLIGDKKIPFSRWWRFIRGAPEAWLINTFDLARPPVPEILVWLNLPAADALDRIRARRELRPHETRAFFERFQDGYRRTAALLGKRRKVTFLEIDISETDPEGVARLVEEACAGRAGTAPKATPAG